MNQDELKEWCADFAHRKHASLDDLHFSIVKKYGIPSVSRDVYFMKQYNMNFAEYLISETNAAKLEAEFKLSVEYSGDDRGDIMSGLVGTLIKGAYKSKDNKYYIFSKEQAEEYNVGLVALLNKFDIEYEEFKKYYKNKNDF